MRQIHDQAKFAQKQKIALYCESAYCEGVVPLSCQSSSVLLSSHHPAAGRSRGCQLSAAAPRPAAMSAPALASPSAHQKVISHVNDADVGEGGCTMPGVLCRHNLANKCLRNQTRLPWNIDNRQSEGGCSTCQA